MMKVQEKAPPIMLFPMTGLAEYTSQTRRRESPPKKLR